jgi:YegS/Rv2252/BmrU family lipid kinase
MVDSKRRAGSFDRAFVVLNPVAGHAQVDVVREVLARYLRPAGISYEVYETSGEERIADVLRSAKKGGFDAFFAAGGDGTVSGVVDGLVGTGKPLGILPVGTGNALARELGIPLDLEAALHLLAGEHTVAELDVGQLGDRYFVLNASIGVSASTMQSTGPEDKRRLGLFAYLWVGIKALAGAQPHRFEVEVDGRPYRWKASELMVANGGAIAEPMIRWGPDIRLNDGHLDLCVIRARNALDYVILAWNVLLGRQGRDGHLHCLCIEQDLSIDAEEKMLVQADGEIVGETPVQIQVLPRALQVIVPMSDEGHRKA